MEAGGDWEMICVQVTVRMAIIALKDRYQRTRYLVLQGRLAAHRDWKTSNAVVSVHMDIFVWQELYDLLFAHQGDLAHQWDWWMQIAAGRVQQGIFVHQGVNFHSLVHHQHTEKTENSQAQKHINAL